MKRFWFKPDCNSFSLRSTVGPLCAGLIIYTLNWNLEKREKTLPRNGGTGTNFKLHFITSSNAASVRQKSAKMTLLQEKSSVLSLFSRY